VFRRLASEPFCWDANTVKDLTPAQAYFYLIDKKHISKDGRRQMSLKEYEDLKNVV
jgi:hypothetical protein